LNRAIQNLKVKCIDAISYNGLDFMLQCSTVCRAELSSRSDYWEF